MFEPNQLSDLNDQSRQTWRIVRSDGIYVSCQSIFSDVSKSKGKTAYCMNFDRMLILRNEKLVQRFQSIEQVSKVLRSSISIRHVVFFVD